ncbi:hypothetical protein AQB9606_04487 [Aquabacterium sp. CECT 9606]|nr:hypothetical protein AQB9606_04487 [Aquabacterium sp. CECT 9606]
MCDWPLDLRCAWKSCRADVPTLTSASILSTAARASRPHGPMRLTCSRTPASTAWRLCGCNWRKRPCVTRPARWGMDSCLLCLSKMHAFRARPWHGRIATSCRCGSAAWPAYPRQTRCASRTRPGLTSSWTRRASAWRKGCAPWAWARKCAWACMPRAKANSCSACWPCSRPVACSCRWTRNCPQTGWPTSWPTAARAGCSARRPLPGRQMCRCWRSRLNTTSSMASPQPLCVTSPIPTRPPTSSTPPARPGGPRAWWSAMARWPTTCRPCWPAWPCRARSRAWPWSPRWRPTWATPACSARCARAARCT